MYFILPLNQLVKREENVKCMMTKVQTSNSLEVVDETRPLTSMGGQVATPEQQIDLLGFWKVGHDRFESHIKCFILKLRPISVKIPRRRKTRLLTFASKKKMKKKVKWLEKEKKTLTDTYHAAFDFQKKKSDN